MNKFPESLCEELDLSDEAKERLNDYMEKAINSAIENSKRITIKVRIGTYDNPGKIERELVFDKNDKLEELFWKLNGILKEEGCELFLGTDNRYTYNGEDIWLREDADDYYNEHVTMVSHFEVDGVLEILTLYLGDEDSSEDSSE
tara:strand:+ start:449 stop:883 length:435 start_codon:yes stop_codon:yes gene_type:complete